MGAYHLAKKIWKCRLKIKWNIKFSSKIEDFLQRSSSFFVRNETAKIYLEFGKSSSFQFP